MVPHLPKSETQEQVITCMGHDIKVYLWFVDIHDFPCTF